MLTEHRYNPVVSRMLSSLARNADWEKMADYLNGLSHSQFRIAGYILSEETLLQLNHNNFWNCFNHIVTTSPKTYLVTFLKAAVRNYQQERVQLDDKTLRHLAGLAPNASSSVHGGRSLNERKTLSMFLPVLRSSDEVTRLFQDFGVEDLRIQIDYLLPVDTTVCSYALFHLLRKLDDDFDYLTEVCRRLIRRGGDHAFNLVSIMKCYFDLPLVNGHFSLRLKAYELSRLDNSYEDFKKIMTSI